MGSAITKYAAQNKMELIIPITRDLNWLGRLITKNVSEKLAEHSHSPILCLK